MKQTCYNCAYFWDSVSNPDDSGDHIHDFCAKHQRVLNSFAYYGWLEFRVDGCIYDDLETGIANCYLFEPREEEQFSDEWFDENKAHNEKLVQMVEDENMSDTLDSIAEYVREHTNLIIAKSHLAKHLDDFLDGDKDKIYDIDIEEQFTEWLKNKLQID